MSASAKSIKAGEAHVELRAKDDRLRKDLTKSAEELGKFGAQAGKLAGGQVAAQIGGPIGLAVAAIGPVLKGLMDEVVFPHEFAKQVERQAVLSEKVLANHEKRIDGVRDALKNLDEVAGTAAGMAQTKDLARQAEKELAGLETSLKAVQKEMARYETLTTDAGTASMWLTGAVTGEGLSDQREKIKPILDERQKAYDAQLKLVTDIRAQLAKVSDPTKNPEAMRAIQSYTKELREQFDVLVGINKETAEQTKLRKMAEQFGFKPGTPGFAAAQKAVKDLNIAQANKALGDFADSLDEQRAAIEDVNFDANRLALEKLLKDNPQADAAARKRANEQHRRRICQP